MRTLAIATGALAAIPLMYAALHLSLIEIGQEVVVVHKRGSDRSLTRARLWIVDDGDVAWLHHGYEDSDWIIHLRTEPIIEIERNGERRRYRATPAPEADPRVHRLLRTKYGFADRLVRMWFGDDRSAGLVTRRSCNAMPVRLEAI